MMFSRSRCFRWTRSPKQPEHGSGNERKRNGHGRVRTAFVPCVILVVKQIGEADKIPPTIGREQEILQMIEDTVARSNSPVAMGRPGVRKTAVVERTGASN